MDTMFSAQQKLLNMSEFQLASGKSTREVDELAFQSGWPHLSGDRLVVPIGYALNMLILSTAKDHGLEYQGMTTWLPWLRNEGLIKLGTELSNWSCDGPAEVQQQFSTMFYASPDLIRPRIAPLLQCCLNVTSRQLRFHSLNDVECLSNAQFELGQHDNRTPLFAPNSHKLAEKLRSACSGPLFTASAVVF